jgi:hypothetical protein
MSFRDTTTIHDTTTVVISTEVGHSFIVNDAVERSPHFVFAVARSFPETKKAPIASGAFA